MTLSSGQTNIYKPPPVSPGLDAVVVPFLDPPEHFGYCEGNNTKGLGGVAERHAGPGRSGGAGLNKLQGHSMASSVLGPRPEQSFIASVRH